MSHSSSPEAEIARLRAAHGLQQFVGRSPLLREHVERLPKIACGRSTVLLLGETGTGKELTARALHYLGSRSDRAFVAVNCGALPAELVENELFGHVAGAYTGAREPGEGLVAEADGGTLFLDEVDSLGAPAQVKLLRFLQEKEIRPVGARRSRKVDVRVIAAANPDLRQALEAGRFRADLFYRLNVIPLLLPPLRARKDDIPDLAAHFVRKYAEETGRDAPGIAPSGLRKLQVHSWPGNIRELENVIERAVLLSEGGQLEAADLLLDALNGADPVPAGDFKTLKARAVAEFERAYITDLLRAHEGNITHAARAAGKHRRALWELIRKHGLMPRLADRKAASIPGA